MEVLTLIDRIKRGDTLGHYEAARVRNNTTELRVSLALSAIKAADGTIVGIMSVDRDVTAARLTRSSQQPQMIVHSEEAIYQNDLTGVISAWSPGAQYLYGFTEEEIVGLPVSVLMPPEPLQRDGRTDRKGRRRPKDRRVRDGPIDQGGRTDTRLGRAFSGDGFRPPTDRGRLPSPEAPARSELARSGH